MGRVSNNTRPFYDNRESVWSYDLKRTGRIAQLNLEIIFSAFLGSHVGQKSSFWTKPNLPTPPGGADSCVNELNCVTAEVFLNALASRHCANDFGVGVRANRSVIQWNRQLTDGDIYHPRVVRLEALARRVYSRSPRDHRHRIHAELQWNSQAFFGVLEHFPQIRHHRRAANQYQLADVPRRQSSRGKLLFAKIDRLANEGGRELLQVRSLKYVIELNRFPAFVIAKKINVNFCRRCCG